MNAPAARGSWRLDFHSQGLDIAGPLAEFINRQLRVALKELGRQVLRVHVRLYGTAGECTCYIRVTWWATRVSTRAWQRTHRGRDYDFGWLERRLAALGFRLVLCTRDPGSFAAARAERIKVSGKPAQYDDLDVFVREQALIRELAAESRLPRLDLDVTGIDAAQAAQRIADWLEATGGLHAPELLS